MKKFTIILIKLSLLFALTMTVPIVKSPTFVTYASDSTTDGGPPIDDGSKSKPKQGAEKKEQPKTSTPGGDVVWMIISTISGTLGGIVV